MPLPGLFFYMSFEEAQEGYREDEWLCTITMNIETTLALYESICYSIKMWPGSPARPAQEQEFLQSMKERLFAMIMEHNFENNEVDRDK